RPLADEQRVAGAVGDLRHPPTLTGSTDLHVGSLRPGAAVCKLVGGHHNAEQVLGPGGGRGPGPEVNATHSQVGREGSRPPSDLDGFQRPRVGGAGEDRNHLGKGPEVALAAIPDIAIADNRSPEPGTPPGWTLIDGRRERTHLLQSDGLAPEVIALQ